MSSLPSALDRLVALLREAREVEWAARLEALRAESLNSSTAAGAAASLTQLFGGMGSLNDLVLCQENHNLPEGQEPAAANQALSAALDDVFREAFLLGRAPADRLAFDGLAQEPSHIPMRVRYAFRRA